MYIYLLICILMIIVLLYIFYNVFKINLIKYFIFKIFGKFKYGNFKFIDDKNKNIIFSKINNKSKKISNIYIKNINNFFTSIWTDGELGIGESYVNNEWYSDNLLLFLTILVLNRNNEYIPKFDFYSFYNKSLDYDKSNISFHYDVGNDFYETFLTDKLSAYTCGFFINNDTSLEEAQLNKVNTIIKKMNVLPNKTILDIGCGWGKIANYVSEQTKCKITGITISKEQVKFIKDSLKNIDVIEQDYRKVNTKFDYIYSIGMFEHVRYENYDSFFSMIKRCLNKTGRFVLHTIISTEKTNPEIHNETFISKHIFPGGQIPNNDWITNAVLRNNLNIIHTEYFGGQHYAKTLHIWRENMLKKKDYILKNYSEKLLNTYDYYFSVCEALFTSGSMGIGHYIITNNDIVDLNNNFVYF
jgi:cyclopropane-fatty-acyl-phospholipid synthase